MKYHSLAFFVAAWIPASGAVAPSRANEALVSIEAPQDDERLAAERTLDRFRAYLLKKPFHEQGFERLVAAAVELNALGGLVGELEAKVEGRAANAERAGDDEAEGVGAEQVDSPTNNPASREERVLLARLYARTDRSTKALALVDGLASELAEDATEGGAPSGAFARALRRLRGELLLTSGAVADGLAELDAAAAAYTALDGGASTAVPSDPRELESLHTLRAEAALRLGDRARAAAAFGDLAAVDPTSFDLALDVADKLARAGLIEAAGARYDAALVLAGDDTPRRCRALAALGELRERRGDASGALAAYNEAYDLLGRGHWLKRRLEERIVAVHTRENSLPALAQTLRTAIEARRDDLDRRTLLASVEVALHDLDTARATLTAASQDFPRDLGVARQLLGVLALVKDDNARVIELQRLVGEHPNELELYIELGQVLASSGQLDQARLQWERTLEGRLTDPGLCLRLAALHAHHGLVDGAVDLLERAITLEPQELGHYDELARTLVRAGRRDDVPAVLDRAEAIAGDSPQQLETLSQLAAAFRDGARARRALERALELAPDDSRLALAAADQARRAGDEERALDLLRRVASRPGDPAITRDAAQRIVRLSRDRLVGLQTDEEARLAVDPQDSGARLIAALAASERRRYADALAHFEALLAHDPNNDAVALLAAQLDERLGNDEAAVARYTALMERQPRQRTRWLGELGRLQHRLGNKPAAVAAFDEVLRLAPDNPASFREVARAFEALGEDARARECLRQVTRLRPDDAEAMLALAELLVAADPDEEPRAEALAEELVLAAVRSDDEDLVERARDWLFERLESRGELRDEITRLREELRQNPFDAERPKTLVDLFVRQGELSLALELLDELLAYRPSDAALLESRAKLHTELLQYDAALADYSELLRLPDLDRDRLLVRVAECHLRAGDIPGAEDALLQVADRMQVLAVYRREGLGERALELLEEEVARAPDDQALNERLLTLLVDRGEFERAHQILRRIIEIRGETPELLQRKALLLRDQGDRAGYTAALVDCVLAVEPAVGPSGDAMKQLTKGGKRALRDEQARERREVFDVQNTLYQSNDWALWSEVVASAAQKEPLRELLVSIAFSELLNNDRFEEAASLLTSANAEREAGRCPVGYTVERWGRILDGRGRQLVRRDPVRAQARAAELEAALAANADALTPDRIKELAALHEQNGDLEALLQLYQQAAMGFPNDLRYACAVPSLQLELGDLDEAAASLRGLLATARLNRATDTLAPSRRDRERLERRLSAELVATVTDEVVDRERRLSARSGVDGSWRAGTRPRFEDVQAALATTLAELGESEEARALIHALEPEHPEHISRAAFVLGLYRDADLAEDAERIEAQLVSTLLATGNHPVLRDRLQFDSTTRDIVMGATLRDLPQLDPGEAYERALRWGGAEAAAAAVVQLGERAADLDEVLRARYRAAVAQELDAGLVRDRALVLAHRLVAAADWTKLSEVMREVSDAAPLDQGIAVFAAESLRLAGDRAEARRLLEAVAAACKAEALRTQEMPPVRVSQTMGFEDVPMLTPVYGLTPPSLEVQLAGQEDFYGQLLYAGTMLQVKDVEKWVPWEIEAALVAHSWRDADWDDVAARLERMFALNPNAHGWVQWELSSAAQTVAKPSAETVALWKVVQHAAPGDADVTLNYGRALEAADRKDEALRLYRGFSGKDAGIEARIAELDPRTLPVEVLPKDLNAAVVADPKNVGLRKALIERLLEGGRYEDAAEHATVLAPLAPHLDEVAALCDQALFLAGRDDEFIEHEKRRLARLQDDEERVLAGVRLASLLYAAGERDGVDAVLRQTFDSQRVQQGYTDAAFWLQRGDREQAIAALERDREAVEKQNSWMRSSFDEALASMRKEGGAASAIPSHALDEFWRNLGGANRVDAEQLADLEELMGEPVEAERSVLADFLRAHVATLTGQRAKLIGALAMRYSGDDAAYEDALVELGTAARGDRGLAIVAVTHARERGDFSRAGSLLQAITAAVAPSARRNVDTALGELTERTALDIELAALEFTMAPEDEAVRARTLQRWREALAGRPEALLVLTRGAGFEEAAHEALAASEAALQAGQFLGENALWAALHLERSSGNAGRSLDRLLARMGGGVPIDRALSHTMLSLARETGRLDELRASLTERWRANPADVGLGTRLLEAIAATDGVRAALDTAASWPAQGTEWKELWRTLAKRARSLPAGDGAVALERQFLERIQDANRRPYDDQEDLLRLALLRTEAGDAEAARAYVDATDTNIREWTRGRVVRGLVELGSLEAALDVLRGAPADAERQRQELELLSDLGRTEEAYPVLLARAVEDPSALLGRARDVRSRQFVGTAVHDAELSAAREALFAAGEEQEAHAAALLRLVICERLELAEAAARLPHLEDLVHVRPALRCAGAWLIADLQEAGRRAEALRFAEEEAAACWRRVAMGRADQAELRARREELRHLVFAERGAEALVHLLQKEHLETLPEGNSWVYSAYNFQSASQGSDSAVRALWAHGLAREAAAALEVEGRPMAERNPSAWTAALRVLLAAGEVDRALAWAFDGLRGGVPNATQACAETFGRVNRRDELEVRLDTWLGELESDAEALDDAREVAHDVRLALAVQRNDGDTVVRLRRAELERDPGSLRAREELAAALLRSGQFDEAHTLANEAADAYAKALFDESSDLQSGRVLMWSPGGPVRFGYGGTRGGQSETIVQGGFITSTNIAYEVHDHEETGLAVVGRGPDVRAELAHLLGRRDEAAALETERIDRAARSLSSARLAPRASVAETYAGWGVPALDAEAMRLYSEDHEHLATLEPTARVVRERASIAGQLAKLAERRGDLDAGARWRAEELELRRDEGPREPSLTERAATLFDAGDAAGALVLLREREQELQATGRWPRYGAEHAHVAAQARAAVKGVEAARLDLNGALAEAPTHERAAATRSLLGM